ncbi:MAG: SRPBCC domain-containing protein [Caldilineaceae bacterium]|nr:SRPBCC domain-containing protein [Caldilineaceae bacterium]
MNEPIAVDGKAVKHKTTFQLDYAVGINIQAPAERIWHYLTDAPGFPTWNSTIERIDGTIAAGQRIVLYAKVAPGRAFKLTVAEFLPAQRMVWSDGNFLFRGERTYTLTPNTAGSTDFRMKEVFGGLMMPMIAASLPNFGPEFERFAADLKRIAEGAS